MNLNNFIFYLKKIFYGDKKIFILIKYFFRFKLKLCRWYHLIVMVKILQIIKNRNKVIEKKNITDGNGC